MENNNCRYGGEGNGGVIYPEITNARDGLTGMALILELMAKTGKRLTEIASAAQIRYRKRKSNAAVSIPLL